MKQRIITLLLVLTLGLPQLVKAQNEGNTMEVQPFTDRTLVFSVADTGVSKPITWGLDLAWLSETNIRRGINFMGKETVEIIRSSFTPTSALENGQLPADELNTLNQRINIINTWLGPMDVVLNCDHPTVDEWYSGNAENWAQLIDVTTRHHQQAGHQVITVSPFNEPDYGWGQGSIDDFYNIAGVLRQNPLFDDIRISGGNTLNCDQALPWYNYLKSRLDEGNTHQLAGSFDNYAAFFETVKANGDHATADELHNTMEAMVGVEYGMQTGIWWGTAELARGEFCKASSGKRLAYTEHRDNWTAASVYRSPDEKVQAFVGSSERQAVTTSYRFVSKERSVYYDGHGPFYEYVVEIPGGTGYQIGQTNAECVVNITWGDDIQPVVNGKYMIVNRNSGLVLEVAGGSSNNGTLLRQFTPGGVNYQQWNVEPVSSRIGGDFSYHKITNQKTSHAPDVNNWSLEEGANIIGWPFSNENQQWFLEYAEDGWFYIRNRHSSKCLTPVNNSNGNGAKIVQYNKNGLTSQHWRFIPVDAAVEFDAPAAPQNLSANANVASVSLSWDANTEDDLAGYNVYRKTEGESSFQTIARSVQENTYIDNSAIQGGPYTYAIKAVDESLNSSELSAQVIATTNATQGLVAAFAFEDNLEDASSNQNNAAGSSNAAYADGVVGKKALLLDGNNTFVQLPGHLPHLSEFSIALWVKLNSGSIRQPIFNFGNGEDEYMYLTPRLRFGLVKGDTHDYIIGERIREGDWNHVAVCMDEQQVKLYLNGVLQSESADFTLSATDILPVLNYIGRGQSFENDDPYLNGLLDELRVYNYALSEAEVAQLASVNSGVSKMKFDEVSLYPIPADQRVQIEISSSVDLDDMLQIGLYDLNGKLIKQKLSGASTAHTLDVSAIKSGTYILKLTTATKEHTQKLLIKH